MIVWYFKRQFKPHEGEHWEVPRVDKHIFENLFQQTFWFGTTLGAPFDSLIFGCLVRGSLPSRSSSLGSVKENLPHCRLWTWNIWLTIKFWLPSYLISVWMLTRAEPPCWTFGERLSLFLESSLVETLAPPVSDLSVFGSTMIRIPSALPCFVILFFSSSEIIFSMSKE